jgi:DNA polymerase bacteriophage-type
VIAWLAGEEWKLQAFREADAGTGPGIYELTYARSFNVPVESVDKDQRQIGKVLELACGFGGGVGAFQAMAKVYGVKVPDKQADAFKNAWRELHAKIKQFWRDLEEASIRAVLNPGAICKAGAEGRQIAYRVAGSFLWCRLPSGRVICYPYPKVQKVMTSWGEEKDQLTFMTVPGDRPQDKARILYDETNRSRWARMSTYGGSLAENVTQAVARDLLAEAIVRVEERGWPVVMHAHDEIVVEVPADAPEDTLRQVEQEMGRLPEWAAGLPVESKGWRGVRYRKD